jgi:hypothetical protein
LQQEVIDEACSQSCELLWSGFVSM